MATFIALITETQKGETHISESVDRATQLKQDAEHYQVKVTGMYWTLGSYDGVLVFETDSDENAAAYLHHVTSQGNVRTQTLRAFDANEARTILQRAVS